MSWFAARRALALAFLWPVLAVGQTSPTEGWLTYQLGSYGVTLKHPPDVVIVPPGGMPTPAPRHRVWFQAAEVAKSPIASVAPPPLAVDVFDNPARERLDDWLGHSGAVSRTPYVREQVEVGGVPAIRVTGSLQLAPNVFYYVARGAFIYRFIPLGPVGEQMLGTVSFVG